MQQQPDIPQTNLGTTGLVSVRPPHSELEKNGHHERVRENYVYDLEETKGAHLWDYWLVVRKHLWVIVGIAVIIPTLVTIYLARQPDVYESQARIQVDLEAANPLLGGMSKNSSIIVNNESNDSAYFNTQLKILTGPGLLRKVVATLDLEHNQDFLKDFPARGTSKWSNLGRILGLKPKSETETSSTSGLPLTSSNTTTGEDQAESERLARYVHDLQEILVVEPVRENRLALRETRLIDISYTHTDPHLAAKIVNTIAQAFVDQNYEKRTETTGTTSTYLQKRIAELQSTIRSKEEQLINYAKNHQILIVDCNSAMRF